MRLFVSVFKAWVNFKTDFLCLIVSLQHVCPSAFCLTHWEGRRIPLHQRREEGATGPDTFVPLSQRAIYHVYSDIRKGPVLTLIFNGILTSTCRLIYDMRTDRVNTNILYINRAVPLQSPFFCYNVYVFTKKQRTKEKITGDKRSVCNKWWNNRSAVTITLRQKINSWEGNEQKQILFNINIQFSKTIALTKQFLIQTLNNFWHFVWREEMEACSFWSPNEIIKMVDLRLATIVIRN